MKYQAVARDIDGQPLANQTINVRVSLLSGAEAQKPVYTEVQQVTTNALGLFNLNLGQGASLKGDFSRVEWESGNKWLQIEIDPNGNNEFINLGATQLLSVPYAFHAGTASKALNRGGHQRSVADSAWLLTGNTGTNAIGNFIGSRDFADLVFKTNNQERMRLSATGHIGIGTTSPSTSFEVLGDAKIGDGSNYTLISNTGDLSFKAGANFLVGPNQFAFRYQLNEDYGLKFNSSDQQYEFTTLGGSGVFTVNAQSGRVYAQGRVGVGTLNPLAKLDVRGNAYFGDGNTHYAQFTSTGDLFFTGADYLVGPNSYAFRYGPNPNFGLFFNSNDAQYEFRDGSTSPKPAELRATAHVHPARHNPVQPGDASRRVHAQKGRLA